MFIWNSLFWYAYTIGNEVMNWKLLQFYWIIGPHIILFERETSQYVPVGITGMR
jgi:hypothetical protein